MWHGQSPVFMCDPVLSHCKDWQWKEQTRHLDILVKPLGVQCLITLTLSAFLHSAFSSPALWREVMTATRVQSSPAFSREGAERSSKILEYRNAYSGLELLRTCYTVYGANRQEPCTPQPGMGWYHHPSDKTARNLCRLEPAEFPILEAGFFHLINSQCGITLGNSLEEQTIQYIEMEWKPGKGTGEVQQLPTSIELPCSGQHQKKIR